MSEFITVHDANVSKRRFPDGKPVRVRASSIDTLRPYPDGRVRTIIGIKGAFLHIIETEDAILHMLAARHPDGPEANGDDT